MATFLSGTRIGYWSASNNYIYANLTGNISRSGNTVTLSGMTLAMTATYNSTGSSDFTFTVNGTSTGFRAYASGTNLGSYSLNSTSLSVSASQTSATISWSSSDGYSGTFNITFPAGGTAPSTPTVSVIEAYPDGAKLSVSIGSYGTPSSEENRYIEGDIFGTSTFGSPYKLAFAYRETSAELIISNSSSGSPADFTILANKQYYFGGYANNTVLSSQTVTGTFVTTASKATITADAIDETSASFNYSLPADGGYYDKTIEYSVDNGATWHNAAAISGASAATGSFTISGLTAGTTYELLSRVTTDAGSTNNDSLSFTTVLVAKLYGSVNGQTKQIDKLYGSIAVPFTYFAVSTIANNYVNSSRFNSRYISTYGFMTVAPSKLLVQTSGSTTSAILKLTDDSTKYLFSYSGTYSGQGSAWGFSAAPVAGNVSSSIVTDYVHESKLITKLYGSLNGVTKRIY